MFGPFDIRGLIPALPDDKSRDITIPVSMWVLDHPKGLVVFDTGNNVAISDGADNCKKYWAPGNCDFLKPSQTRADVIDTQLKKLGYSTDQVKVVVTSHTHLDHVGNIEMFPKAIHVFQKKELYQGWWPEKFQGRTTPGSFVMADMDNAREFNYLELDGDYDLFGDGTVLVLSTPGHTLGHQSMKVKLPQSGTHHHLAGRHLDAGKPGRLPRRPELQRPGLHQFGEPPEVHARPRRRPDLSWRTTPISTRPRAAAGTSKPSSVLLQTEKAPRTRGAFFVHLSHAVRPQ